MKIGNKFIKINNGKQCITIQNTILDNYLKAVKNIQFTTESSPTDIQLTYISFKFNEPIRIDEAREYTMNDFEYSTAGALQDISYLENNVIVDYYYRLSRNELSDYVGAKITAIAFGYSDNGYKCGAIVDTSNYDLYIVEDSELQITRRDIFSTDGLIYANDNMGLLHMFPNSREQYTQSSQSGLICRWGVLKSVGLGVSVNEMLEEYDFEDFEQELAQSDFGYEINRVLTIEHDNEGLFPATDLYPGTNLYPARVIREPLYPSKDIYPNIYLYPTETPYQYVQLKYQIYEYNDFEVPKIKALNKYYIISNKINSKLYKIKEQVKYERATQPSLF